MLALLCLPALLAVLPPLPQEATVGERAAAHASAPVGELTWMERIERNRRVSFTALSGSQALELLESKSAEKLSPAERAAALFTLGVAGLRAERARLEAATETGSALERQAATLALGALGPGSISLLIAIAGRSDALQADCACLALLYSGQQDARGFVEARAAGDQRAQALMAFARDAAAAPPSDAGALYLDLRYLAAQRFGLIDSQSWKVLMLLRLAEQPAFLDQLVYRSALALKRPGMSDHFLGVLMEDPGEAALRAAVALLPNEISQMVAAGLWTPRADQWAIVLDEIAEDGLETLAEPLLLHALAQPEQGGLAALLLVRAGNMRGRPILEAALQESGPQLKRRTAEALGASGNTTWQTWLALLREDKDPEVRAAAMVAQMLLGNAHAKKTLQVLLLNPELAQRDVPVELLVGALARTKNSPVALELLEDALPSLEGASHLEAATALALNGRSPGIEVVRAELLRAAPRGDAGARLVRALGRYPDSTDIELLTDLFPQEDDVAVNAALAEILHEARLPLIARFLRIALWRAPFHRSQLAAALLVDLQGIDALRFELETPPPQGSRPEDRRRVGFALGELGGLVQVDLLFDRVGAGDPGLQGAVLGALSARTR
jgi:hypothetical protein